MTLTFKRTASVSAVIIAVAAGAVAFGQPAAAQQIDGPVAAVQPAVLDAAIARAAAGAKADRVTSREAQVTVLKTGPALRAAAQERLAVLALPPGHQPGIDWDAAAVNGGDSVAGVALVSELDAACQWLGYVSARDISANSIAAVEAVATWPSIRGSDSMSGHFSDLVEQLRSGDTSGIDRDVAVNCPSARR